MGSAPIVLASTRSVVFHSSLHTRLPGCLPFESLAVQGLFFIRPFRVVSPINIDILGRHYRDLTPVCTAQVFLRVEACIQGLGPTRTTDRRAGRCSCQSRHNFLYLPGN